MFDSKNFQSLLEKYDNHPVGFVFYDRFTKKYGPLNSCSNIKEAVFNACNFLKSVEDKNISLEHIDVYIAGIVEVHSFSYELLKDPLLFFNGSDYKQAYNLILEEVQNV